MILGNEILNAKEAAAKLGISKSYFFKLVKHGMPYHQIGLNSRKYYIISEIIEWLQSN